MKKESLVFLLGLFFTHCVQAMALFTDKEVTSLPIIDNNEEMIDLTQQNDICYGAPAEYPGNQDYTKMRKSVYLKLKQAQSLLPEGLKFCVYEAYRTPDLQEKLFRVHFQQMQAAYHDLPYEEIFFKTAKMISPARHLDGTPMVAPHATGGAISVYLVDKNKQPVDMGISPQDWKKDREDQLSEVYADGISSSAQHYRDIMADALKNVGFVNYPGLYWHWSYGDNYWAYVTHQDHAIYGSWQKSS